ncbi:MAG: hydrogenase maturation protease [Thermoanaerobaculia bacterium]
MSRIVIIGYGNTLRGDDAAGWLAAEALSESFDETRVTVLKKHQLAPELAETISAFDVALFVDATREGEPGELRCAAVEPVLTDSGLTHSASPEALLYLARELYGRTPQAFLFSLCGESFDLVEQLTPRIADALPRLVGLVGAKALALLD